MQLVFVYSFRKQAAGQQALLQQAFLLKVCFTQARGKNVADCTARPLYAAPTRLMNVLKQAIYPQNQNCVSAFCAATPLLPIDSVRTYNRQKTANFSFWLYHSFNNISTSSKLSKSRIASIGTLPPQSCSQSYRRLLIYDLKRTLTAKEFSVIYALIFKELSVAEIAEKQGISRQAVNQMKNSAIKKLRSR